NYDVTITDAHGGVGMVSASLFQPAPLVISSSFMDVSCNGFTNGSIDITVSGCAGGNTFEGDNSKATEDISNLSVGNYSVVVTDLNSCTANASFTISEPNALTLASSINDVSCNGGSNGSIDLTITGGTTPYTFDWDNDGTGDNDDAEDL